MEKATRIFFAWATVLIVMAGVACTGNSKNKQTAQEAVDPTYDIRVEDMVVRDPFIFVDRKTGTYYMQANGGNKNLICYASKDLQHWKKTGNSFVADSLFWGQRDFWAPDMFEYRGKYYILATFSHTHSKRGTSFLVSDKPEGPYYPLNNRPVTPPGWTCLDATLYIDENQTPWLLYSREWIEVGDGQVVIQQLSDDLTHTQGDPRILFTAAQAPWTGPIQGENIKGYVTDAPFLFRTSGGELLIIWSSFTKEGKYAIGVARSDNGRISGSWIPGEHPLNDDDGGHAMLFKNLDGEWMISYHAPNMHPSRPRIVPVDSLNERLFSASAEPDK